MRIAVIGMVTPNSTLWDAENLKKGKLELKYSEDGRTPNVSSFTEEELSAALEK